MPDRILIIRLSHLGDVVHALGVFHALHEAYPQAEIAWVTQPEFAGLLDGLPGLARVFRFGRRDGLRAWPRLRRELRAFRADLTIDAQGNLKSAGVALCAGAPRRCAPARADWREPLGALVANDQAPPVPADAVHAMDRMVALARHVAPDVTGPLRLDPGLSTAERTRGEELLLDHLPGGGAGAVLCHLSSPGDIRAWPVERWRELAEVLAEQHRPVLFLSGPAEEETGRRLADDLGARDTITHWIGQRGLRDLASFFTAAGQRGAQLVSADSGPLHLAVACGLDVVALAGPQDWRRTGPWLAAKAGAHRVVHVDQPPDCAPCLARRCDHHDGPVCMAGIAVADVWAVL